MRLFTPNVEKLEAKRDTAGLVRALHAHDSHARLIAAEAIGRLGDMAAVAPLVIALKDPEPDVRIAGVTSLGRIAEKGNVVSVYVLAVEALAASLQDPEPSVRHAATASLVSIADKLLSCPEPAFRQAAATTLGRVADRAAIEPLSRAVRDSDPDVRRDAVRSLGRLGEPRAAELLAAGLDSGDLALRPECARALGLLAATATPGDDGEAVRSAVSAALADHPRAAACILTASGFPQDVRRCLIPLYGAAVAAVEAAGEPWVADVLIGIADDPEMRRSIINEAVAAVVRLGADAVEPLAAALEEGRSERVELAAVVALGRIGGPRAAEALIGALAHSGAATRKAAAAALGEIGGGRALEALGAALSDQDALVRRAVVQALEVLGAASIEVFIASVNNSSVDPEVRSSAARILGDFADPRAVEPLATAMSDEERSVRRAAVIALRRTGDHRAEQPLAREIDAALRELFSAPREGTAQLLDSFVPVSALSADVARWAEEASGYAKARDPDQIRFGHIVEHVALSASDDAIAQLCRRDNPVTSNILHLVAEKPSITVTLSTCSFEDKHEIDFQPQREMALRELRSRGDPPYRAKAYVAP